MNADERGSMRYNISADSQTADHIYSTSGIPNPPDGFGYRFSDPLQ